MEERIIIHLQQLHDIILKVASDLNLIRNELNNIDSLMNGKLSAKLVKRS